jgi:hypothetical protein
VVGAAVGAKEAGNTSKIQCVDKLQAFHLARSKKMRAVLLWLLGVPIPIIILLAIFFN